MRLELSIVSIIFLVFLMLSYVTPKPEIEYILFTNESFNETPHEVAFIMDQITNSTNNTEVLELRDRDEMIEEEELKRKNEEFDKITATVGFENVTK